MRHRPLILMAWLAPLGGCGTSAPPADLPLRDAAYYTSNPAEVLPMQKVCDQWRGSSARPAAIPAVVVHNCNALLEAKESAKRQAALRAYRGEK